MPHQCVRCSKFYSDGSEQILKGCSCGSKLFFFVKKSALEKQAPMLQLSQHEKEQIEKDVYDILGATPQENRPIILDLESINIVKPGQFELDLVNLFNQKNPIVYKLEEGKYMIDIPESFRRNKMEKKTDKKKKR